MVTLSRGVILNGVTTLSRGVILRRTVTFGGSVTPCRGNSPEPSLSVEVLL